MPLWADADLAAMSPEVAQRIISILTKCTKGIDKVGVAPLGRSAVRPLVQPDPGIVQQIVEMGFPAARAEQALRRVCEILLPALKPRNFELNSSNAFLFEGIERPISGLQLQSFSAKTLSR